MHLSLIVVVTTLQKLNCLLWMPQFILDFHFDLLLLVNPRLDADQNFSVLVWLLVGLISYLGVPEFVWDVKRLTWYWNNSIVTVIKFVLYWVSSRVLSRTTERVLHVLLLLLLVLDQALVGVIPDLLLVTEELCLASSQDISFLGNKIRQVLEPLGLFRIKRFRAGNTRRKVDPLVLAAVQISGFSISRVVANPSF